jgi:hypothetical protein
VQGLLEPAEMAVFYTVNKSGTAKVYLPLPLEFKGQRLFYLPVFPKNYQIYDKQRRSSTWQ